MSRATAADSLAPQPKGVTRVTADGVHVFDFRHLAGTQRWVAQGVDREPETVDLLVLGAWDGLAFGALPPAPLQLALDALSRAPFHAVAGVGIDHRGQPVGVVALLHPIGRYLHTVGPANQRALSVGVLGRFAEDETARDVRLHGKPWVDAADEDPLRAAIVLALAEVSADMLAASNGRPPTVITRRQCLADPPRHSADPGEAVIGAAIHGGLAADLALTFDADLVVGEGGQPWPDAWRRHLPDITVEKSASDFAGAMRRERSPVVRTDDPENL